MIVLGIDPGTAALGYGLVEEHGGPAASRRLRLPRHLAPTCPSATDWRRSTRCVADLISSHRPALIGRRAALLQPQRPDGVRRRPGPRRRPPGGRPGPDPRSRGDPQRGQARGRRLRLGRQGSRSSRWSRRSSAWRRCPSPTTPPTPWRWRSASPTGSDRLRPVMRPPIARRPPSSTARRSSRSPAAGRPTSGPSAKPSPGSGR